MSTAGPDLSGILGAYAALSGETPAPPSDVVGGDGWWSPYPLAASNVFKGKRVTPAAPLLEAAPYSRVSSVLSATQLSGPSAQLTLGWLWFAGTTEVDGKLTSWCFPAISVPVKRAGFGIAGSYGLEPVGDPEVTPLIAEESVATRLAEDAHFGGGALWETAVSDMNGRVAYETVDHRLLKRLTRMERWAREIAGAVGLSFPNLVLLSDEHPLSRRAKPGIAAIATHGIYLTRDVFANSTQASLLRFARMSGLSASAFGSMFGHGVEGRAASDPKPLGSTSRRQARALTQISATSLAALSGPPGTGKSHLLAIAAAKAVAAGQSVLCVAGSKYATEVLADYLTDLPGPPPIVFDGSTRSRERALDLLDLVDSKPTGLQACKDEVERSAASLDRFTAMFAGLARTEELRRDRDELDAAIDRNRRLGERQEVLDMLNEFEDTPGFRWFHRRALRAEIELRLGEGEPRNLLAERSVDQFAYRAVHGEPIPIGELIDELHSLHAATARALNTLLTERWLSGLDATDRLLLKELGYALSSTRSERAETFTRADPAQLTRVAPLWVGTLSDVERILPILASMFDLVVFDEAAQTNPIDASGALVRARNVIVCGDPVQLGHNSFLSGDEIEAAAAAHGVEAELIDPGRQSIFDVAAARVPVTVLDEHFRSDPHLIEFSSRRFYDGALQVMTRNPANHAADHIDVQVADGERNSSKVNEAEVAECLRLVGEFSDRGWTSIGLVSPFRAQADALRQAVLDTYGLRDIDKLGLRTGTVHSFQGDERRLMIMSWAVGCDEGDRAWQFVNQANLFNVMVTRAREHVVVVTSNPEPPGRAGEYVRWSEPFEDLVADVEVDDPWILELVERFRTAGISARPGYRVGHHVIDLVLGDGAEALALDCVPHRDGPEAHLDRALHLRRMGWRTADAYQANWRHNPAELITTLSSVVR